MGASTPAYKTVAILQLPNIQYPLAKVLYGGKVQRGMLNDEVFSFPPL
jgi:hypothetical protein